MHLKIDKKFRFIIYIIIILFLSTTTNYNFYNKKIFNIEQIEINGFSEKKNLLVIINFIPAKPLCVILFENDKIILGDNGKILEFVTIDQKLPSVYGSKNIRNIFKVVNLLILSNIDYYKIDRIIFFKSGRFDISLDKGTLIKYPINYSKKIINYSSELVNDKKFINSKIIDLRINNKIIKYE